MIDMHTHLLPNVDDGTKTMEESIMMIQEAEKNGVKSIIITPHYRPTKEYVCDNQELKQSFEELRKEVKKQGIKIDLYLGREIDEAKDIKELIENNIVETMNDTKYVLLDFGVNQSQINDYIYEVHLMGYKVIVAHVERYKYIEGIDCFNRIKNEGALIQINASSILKPRNAKTRRHVKYLLKNNMVDFVASDAHRNPESYNQFKKAYEYVAKKYGHEYAEKLFVGNAKEMLL